MLMMESQETRSHVAARRPGRSGLRTQKEASCVMHRDSRPKLLELAQESCTSSPHSLAFRLLANGCGRPDGPGRQPCHTSKAVQVTETAVPRRREGWRSEPQIKAPETIRQPCRLPLNTLGVMRLDIIDHTGWTFAAHPERGSTWLDGLLPVPLRHYSFIK